jgi:hypothetical protein
MSTRDQPVRGYNPTNSLFGSIFPTCQRDEPGEFRGLTPIIIGPRELATFMQICTYFMNWWTAEELLGDRKNSEKLNLFRLSQVLPKIHR